MSYVGTITAGGATHLVGSTLYGTCTTAAATAAKVVTCTDFDQLITGVEIRVKFTNSNTVANPTLNVNGTGAKAIYRYGTTRPSTTAATSWQAGAVVSFTYDGTNWIITGWLNDNTTYNAATRSAAGLMSAADKQTLDELSAKMEGSKMLIDIAAGPLEKGSTGITFPFIEGTTMVHIKSFSSSYEEDLVLKDLKSGKIENGKLGSSEYSVNANGEITFKPTSSYGMSLTVYYYK